MPEAAVAMACGGLLQGPAGCGEDDVGGGVGVGGLVVGVLARADRVEDVALGEDAEAAGVGVEDDGRADPAGRHQLLVRGARLEGRPTALVDGNPPRVLVSRAGRAVLALDIVVPIAAVGRHRVDDAAGVRAPRCRRSR